MSTLTRGYQAESETVLRLLGGADPTTRVMMEGILAKEEEHAKHLVDLLAPWTRRSSPDGRALSTLVPRCQDPASLAVRG